MAVFASITVKKNDGTTDAIYVNKTPANGDGSVALWRYDSHAAPYAGLKPELRMMSKWNGPKTARRLQVDFAYKAYATDSTTGVSSLLGTIPFTLTGAVPQSIPQADIDEAVSQMGNLIVSTLIRAAMKEGFSPT